MSRKPLLVLLLIGFAALTAPSATAQLSRIPNTGCQPAVWPRPSGQAQVGQSWSLTCPPCNPGDLDLIFIGISGLQLPFNPPIACQTNCVFECRTIVALMAPSVTLQIPNNPNLIGVCVCFQCGCFDTGVGCFTLSGAFDACIIP